ncbi:hypothetical protein EVJ58_g2650 [Rhodofomes roseus]|uniref:Uncharacterized protein n=1 Tax=Rhodofomes roseus TaxID=34475 RepID=A0A4Y9YRN3_9APHY|nr:hypothetical protein EVJ58_g2650 [Rhodofomes roseus]
MSVVDRELDLSERDLFSSVGNALYFLPLHSNLPRTADNVRDVDQLDPYLDAVSHSDTD